MSPHSSAQALGALCGLGAALSFGLSPPLAKILVTEIDASLLAGLLYLGAAIVLTAPVLHRTGATAEARLQRGDLLPLAGLIVAGGIVGPGLMLAGLARTSAMSGSLLLNLEAPLTMILAVALFGEHLGRRAATAAVLIVLGAATLTVSPQGRLDAGWGSLAIAGACLSWALDNNLTQRLSVRDPRKIVWLKASGAALGNLALAFAMGSRLPAWSSIAAALLLGSVSYGLSILLDTYALRFIGAAREAAYFATAPFFGASVAWLILGEPLTALELGAAALMVAGVALLVRENHAHEHVHEPLEHDHAHVHDAHHVHDHGRDGVAEPHSHPHRHDAIRHAHPHVSDVHHRHRH